MRLKPLDCRVWLTAQTEVESAVGDAIAIENDEDWESKLRRPGLTLVVDPMIFRTADVFLRGARGAPKDPQSVWRAITANLGSLSAFIDCLVLHERMPIFDYNSSFPEWDASVDTKHTSLVDFCNADDVVLCPVTVGYGQYLDAKKAALAELALHPPVPPATAAKIVRDLSTFDYAWTPDLGPDANRLGEHKSVATFVYGGLLFSGYAQRLGGEHLVNPSRSAVEIELATGLAADAADASPSRAIERLAAEVPEELADPVDFPQLPSFLPYLLTKDPVSPQQLVRDALKLRGAGAVKDYRAWRKDLGEDLAKGRTAREKAAEVTAIAEETDRRLGGSTRSLKWTASLTAFTIPKFTVEGEWKPRRIHGWALRQLPGYRYQKLLMRLMIADSQYRRVDRHLQRIWAGL